MINQRRKTKNGRQSVDNGITIFGTMQNTEAQKATMNLKWSHIKN